MRLHRIPTLLVCSYLALALAACSGGGDDGPSCSFDNPATFATDAAWPKFRRDAANTGALTITSAASFALLSSPNKEAQVFPADGAKGSFTASPVISTDGARVYIGSNDGILYAIRTSDWTQDTAFNLVAGEPFVAPALIVRRSDLDAIFVGSVDGRLHGVDESSAIQSEFWPPLTTVPVDRAANLGTDGTVYTGSSGGFFFALCPNGVLRFSLPVGDVTTVAIDADSTVYFATDDSQLRAIRYDGVPRWSFSTSKAVRTAPVLEIVDQEAIAIYAADTGGRVFKVDEDGRPITGFHFAGAPIHSSPALASNTLYFGSDDGAVHAISTATGDELDGWPVQTGGAVASSPAVAVFGNERVVVVGSNDGNLYFIHQIGNQPPTVASYSVGSQVQSSPAIGADGTVYVGGLDGHVYAVAGVNP